MGCGCGKNKNKNRQSSRMPGKPCKKIGNISIPENMSANQRRSTIAKINNDKKSIKNKHPREIRRRMNIADHIMHERVRDRIRDSDG